METATATGSAGGNPQGRGSAARSRDAHPEQRSGVFAETGGPSWWPSDGASYGKALCLLEEIEKGKRSCRRRVGNVCAAALCLVAVPWALASGFPVEMALAASVEGPAPQSVPGFVSLAAALAVAAAAAAVFALDAFMGQQLKDMSSYCGLWEVVCRACREDAGAFPREAPPEGPPNLFLALESARSAWALQGESVGRWGVPCCAVAAFGKKMFGIRRKGWDFGAWPKV